jgi:hypothetical protein
MGSVWPVTCFYVTLDLGMIFTLLTSSNTHTHTHTHTATVWTFIEKKSVTPTLESYLKENNQSSTHDPVSSVLFPPFRSGLLLTYFCLWFFYLFKMSANTLLFLISYLPTLHTFSPTWHILAKHWVPKIAHARAGREASFLPLLHSVPFHSADVLWGLNSGLCTCEAGAFIA